MLLISACSGIVSRLTIVVEPANLLTSAQLLLPKEEPSKYNFGKSQCFAIPLIHTDKLLESFIYRCSGLQVALHSS